jgi:UDP:flavonoid glycosyltransferase YjiC (YdhE family)
VFRTALEAVSELAARVLLTVGHAFDVGRLGSVPQNTHVESWVAQADVLAEAALVACHGGSGTTFGSLAAGVPLVMCPLFADQTANGQVIETAACGLVVGGQGSVTGHLRALGPADVGPLRDAIERVLNESAYRRAAERVAAEIAATAGLDQVVGQLGVS